LFSLCWLSRARGTGRAGELLQQLADADDLVESVELHQLAYKLVGVDRIERTLILELCRQQLHKQIARAVQRIRAGAGRRRDRLRPRGSSD